MADANGTSTPPAPPPPEIEATLARLSAYRNVRGVMILARSASSSAGPSGPVGGESGDGPAEGATSPSTSPSGIIQSTGAVFEGESGRRYAGALEAVVTATAGAVAAVDEGVSLVLWMNGGEVGEVWQGGYGG